MLPDYYQILGIPSHATREEIRSAYRRLARQHHPDAGGDPSEFRSLREAYNILTDPVRRRSYDAQRQPRLPRTLEAEPLIPSTRVHAGPRQSPRVSGFSASDPLDHFDRLFREFDAFFERLEEEFWGPWGRNE